MSLSRMLLSVAAQPFTLYDYKVRQLMICTAKVMSRHAARQLETELAIDGKLINKNDICRNIHEDSANVVNTLFAIAHDVRR